MRNNKIYSVAILGAGFIGTHLIRKHLDAGHRINVLDHNECPDEFLNKLNWHRGEFSDTFVLNYVLSSVDVVYHLISSTVPSDQNLDIATEIKDNVFSTLELIRICEEKKVKRLVYASSASVYGHQQKFPISESASTWPISAHGIHKHTVEKFLWLAHNEKKVEVRILRISNPYGPGQSISGRQGFIAIALGCMINDRKLKLTNNGNIVRDFIYIEDLISIMTLAGLTDNVPFLMNLSSGEETTLKQILDIIEHSSGKHIALDLSPLRHYDIPISVLDNSTIKNLFNFKRFISIKKGINLTLGYHGLL